MYPAPLLNFAENQSGADNKNENEKASFHNNQRQWRENIRKIATTTAINLRRKRQTRMEMRDTGRHLIPVMTQKRGGRRRRGEVSFDNNSQKHRKQHHSHIAAVSGATHSKKESRESSESSVSNIYPFFAFDYPFFVFAYTLFCPTLRIILPYLPKAGCRKSAVSISPVYPFLSLITRFLCFITHNFV
jgi:hypothetical protein